MIRVFLADSPWHLLLEVKAPTQNQFEEELAYVRSLPEARFRPDLSMWQVSSDALASIWETRGLEGADWTFLPWEFGLTDPPDLPSETPVDDFERDLFKGDILDFQSVSSSLLYYRERAIITDDVGLGKTITAIRAMLKGVVQGTIERALVITRPALKNQWAAEISRFTDLKPVVIYGDAERRRRLWTQAAEADVAIVNYDLLLREDFDAMRAFDPQVIICDEAHYLKNHTTKRTKKALALSKDVRYWWGLTATPTTGKLEELWSLFQFVNPDLFGKISHFTKTFCIPAFRQTGKGLKFSGFRDYKNRPILRAMTRPWMLGRKADQIGHELPKVLPIYRKIQPSPDQKKLFERIEDQLGRLSERMLEAETDSQIEQIDALQIGTKTLHMMASADTSLLLGSDSHYARSLAAGLKPSSPKLNELIELATVWANAGHKFLVFTEFVQMAHKIDDHLSQIEYVAMIDDEPVPNFLKTWVITGEVSKSRQAQIADEFRRFSLPGALILDRAGQEGLNLQVADIVCLFDIPWTPNDVKQRLGRIRRLASPHQSVRVYFLITEGSIDEAILKLHRKRQFNISHVV